ncbi:hypothetical protein Tco_0161678 [Tanacetum coccineum]
MTLPLRWSTLPLLKHVLPSRAAKDVGTCLNLQCVYQNRHQSMDPIFSTFNASTLEQTDIEFAVPEHGASSSRGP